MFVDSCKTILVMCLIVFILYRLQEYLESQPTVYIPKNKAFKVGTTVKLLKNYPKYNF